MKTHDMQRAWNPETIVLPQSDSLHQLRPGPEVLVLKSAPDDIPERLQSTEDEQYIAILGALATDGEKPLEQDELIACAKDVEAGLYADYMLKGKLGNERKPRPTADLAAMTEAGKTALRRLLSTHVNQVRNTVRYEMTTLGVFRDSEREYALQIVGMRGLLRAIHKYDYRTENRLTTYANNWIRTFVQRAIYSEDWKVSRPQAELIRSFRSQRNRLAGSLMREPTNEELAKAMQVTPKQYNMAKDLHHLVNKRLASAEFEDAKQTGKVLLTPGNCFESATVDALTNILGDQTHGASILLMYFSQHLTHAEISERLGISKAAVGYWKKKALKQVRAVMTEEQIRELLGQR